MTTVIQRIASLRTLADKMDADIAAKLDPPIGRQNLTARRARIADSMRRDGLRLQQVQTVLRKLADAHEKPELWPDLEAIWPNARGLHSKANITKLAFEGRAWVDATNSYTASVLDKLAGTPNDADTTEGKVRRLERALLGMKIPGFFPTPAELAAQLVELANVKTGDQVLEPSAGKGDIADKIRELHPDATVHTVEVNSRLAAILQAKRHQVTCGDCLQMNGNGYDRIAMNPPFEKGADIAHVRYCFDHLLKPGGRLVSVVSEGPFFRSDKSSIDFREFVERHSAREPLKLQDAFKGAQAFRQTGVPVRVIVLDKPATPAEPQHAAPAPQPAPQPATPAADISSPGPDIPTAPTAPPRRWTPPAPKPRETYKPMPEQPPVKPSTDPRFEAERCPDALTTWKDRAAWFKKHAPREDVKFIGRSSELVRAEAIALLDDRRPITRDDAVMLRDRWRRLARLRETGREAILPPFVRPSGGSMKPTATAVPVAQNRATTAPSPKATATKPTKVTAKKTSGRGGVDWAAAGRKAYETRMRNQRAKQRAAKKAAAARSAA